MSLLCKRLLLSARPEEKVEVFDPSAVEGRAAEGKKARQEAAADAEEEDQERPSKRKSGGVAASTATGGKAQDSPAPTEDDEVDKTSSDHFISNTLLGVKGSLTSQVVHIKEQAEAAK
eukprot:jgi/Tetstr1/463665/TSEL_008526.t1